ncbi:ABC transporter ATP-binding protein [Roseomonas elaeocarpi]|uniref:ABC transporter ATP-binding protein n=1 Tax=Roseomonas elaeocarpi TaxID=907779 RepID=A0ABV6JN20_9PROT
MNAVEGRGHLAATAASPILEARGLQQSYGDKPVLRDIGFALQPGRVLALLGPSGCGKTTLLRLVAGLLRPTGGALLIDGRVVAEAEGAFVPPEGRGLGMVFQDYALWPHLSVGGNVGFPLEMRGMARAERERRVTAALARVGLDGFARRKPGELSGGQQQRVAIARAIVAEPRLVLFDEPLSNLDRELRESLVGEIAQLVAGLGLSALYVTHDQAEAFALADSVAVMGGGRIAQLDAPEALVGRPATPAVAEFLRLGTLATVTPRADGWWLPGGEAPILPRGTGPAPDAPQQVLIPRRALRLVPLGEAALRGMVTGSLFAGDRHAVTVQLPGAPPLDLRLDSARRAAPGETVGIAVATEELCWFASPP